MSQQQREQKSERDRLLEWGIPSNVVDYALSFPKVRWFVIAYGGAFVITYFGGLIMGAALLLSPLIREANANAREHALAASGILYKNGFGITIAFGFVAWMFAIWPIIVPLMSATPRLLATSFVYSILGGRRSGVTDWITRKSIAAASQEIEPCLYLRKVVLGYMPWCAGIAIVFAVLSLAAANWEAKAYSIITLDAYIDSPSLPWEQPQHRSWAAAESVALGCNHTIRSKGSDTDDLLYDIDFPDGEHVFIQDYEPVAGTWIDQANLIDAKLRELGLRFHHTSLSPACLEAWKRKLGIEDYTALKKLLRAGHMGGDPPEESLP